MGVGSGMRWWRVRRSVRVNSLERWAARGQGTAEVPAAGTGVGEVERGVAHARFYRRMRGVEGRTGGVRTF